MFGTIVHDLLSYEKFAELKERVGRPEAIDEWRQLRPKLIGHDRLDEQLPLNGRGVVAGLGRTHDRRQLHPPRPRLKRSLTKFDHRPSQTT